MAVPVALGAARVEKPLAGTYAKVGLDSRFPNALVCQHKGELIILTYEESAAPIKHGMVSFSGTIHAVPLREALKDYLHAQENQESEQTPPPADSESNSGHK